MSIYETKVSCAIRNYGWDPITPRGEVPQGILLARISAMIEGSERAVYDIGTENGNVCFELGISLALRQPVALMSDRDPGDLPNLFRSPWLYCYTDSDTCVSALTGFLGLENPLPLVPRTQVPGDPALVVVIGTGDRARGIERALQASGHSVVYRNPNTIRSVAESIQLAESCGALVAARPAADRWSGDDAIAALVTLGAAHGAGRTAIIGAGPGEQVPSDCAPLVTRGADDVDLAANVIEQIEQSAPPLPLGGAIRPTAEEALPRALTTPVAEQLRIRGRGLLSAEPGYGKTTLLHQVADRLGYPTAWVTIEANWSAESLIARIVAAVGEHVSRFGWQAWAAVRRSRQAAEVMDSRVAPLAVPHPHQLAELLVDNATADASEPVLLVFDDVHKATVDGAKLLDRLTQCAPPWLRLLFAGRGAPAPIQSAADSGGISCWTAEDLQFSRCETKGYLAQTVPGLDDERADLLHERSGGWPAALAIIRAWLSANTNVSIETLTDMTRGDRRRIYRLFAADYFGQLSQRAQDDLLVCSVPLRLDASVAQQLLGTDGGRRLRTLANGPYFLAEEEAGTFRIHSLFREFLSQRWIEDRGLTSLQDARSALARWYQDREDPVSAYQMACEGENWSIAIDVIEPLARAFASRGDVGFLKELLDPLPIDRVRERRSVWESRVRALAYTGSAESLEEARAFATAQAPSIVDQAVADLILAEVEHNLGHLSDEDMADACNRIAASVSGHDNSLGFSARLLSLDARLVRSFDPVAWPQLEDEARQLLTEAEAADALAVAAGACVAAADLASRSVETELRSEGLQLRILESFGNVVPLATRLARASHFLARFDEVTNLYDRALRLAEAAKSPLVVARVQIALARFIVLNTSLAVIQSGDQDESTRTQANNALQLALHAAKAYSDFGAPRGAAIALNAAAEAASVLGDQTRISSLTQEASRIAAHYGFDDLRETAERISEEPTAPDLHRRAQAPRPFNHQSSQELNEFVEQMIGAAPVSPSDAELVRPVLRDEAADLALLGATCEEVCQYLALLRDRSGPRVGPFFAELSWRTTCRLRGISSVEQDDRAGPLLQRFMDGFCSNCELRSPGQAIRNPGEDEDMYAPLLERLSRDRAGAEAI
ncbi:MAG: AAA family ATPase [Chloroflexi bacterium]|nr:AAA family ATPase [Chloroflexota bacterium]